MPLQYLLVSENSLGLPTVIKYANNGIGRLKITP